MRSRIRCITSREAGRSGSSRHRRPHVHVARVDADGVVDDPVQYGVGVRSAAEPRVPVRHRVLGAPDGRGPVVPALDELQEEAHLVGGQRVDEPLVICEARVYAKPTELIQVDRDCGHIDFA